MKIIRQLFRRRTAHSVTATIRQLEFDLPGSILTREEARFFDDIRHLRARLEMPVPAGK